MSKCLSLKKNKKKIFEGVVVTAMDSQHEVLLNAEKGEQNSIKVTIDESKKLRVDLPTGDNIMYDGFPTDYTAIDGVTSIWVKPTGFADGHAARPYLPLFRVLFLGKDTDLRITDHLRDIMDEYKPGDVIYETNAVFTIDDKEYPATVRYIFSVNIITADWPALRSAVGANAHSASLYVYQCVRINPDGEGFGGKNPRLEQPVKQFEEFFFLNKKKDDNIKQSKKENDNDNDENDTEKDELQWIPFIADPSEDDEKQGPYWTTIKAHHKEQMLQYIDKEESIKIQAMIADGRIPTTKDRHNIRKEIGDGKYFKCFFVFLRALCVCFFCLFFFKKKK